jgi:hypothetical protein
MPRKSLPKAKQDDPEQFKRFVETAKEIGADLSPKDFDKAFRRVTGSHPKPSKRGKRPSA